MRLLSETLDKCLLWCACWLKHWIGVHYQCTSWLKHWMGVHCDWCHLRWLISLVFLDNSVERCQVCVCSPDSVATAHMWNVLKPYINPAEHLCMNTIFSLSLWSNFYDCAPPPLMRSARQIYCSTFHVGSKGKWVFISSWPNIIHRQRVFSIIYTFILSFSLKQV